MNSDRLSTRLRSRIRRLKTLPVLPTLLTSGNLACGITAILCASHYHPTQHPEFLTAGALLIFAAMIFDMLDGKVARMTRTDGPFGAELDSLSDVVSFGVAPAILVHRMILEQSGVFDQGVRLLWFFTVFYPVMAAIRLARYNVEANDGPTTHFRGLPSPGAAAVVCAWIIFARWWHDELTAMHLLSSDAYSGLMNLDPFRIGLLCVMVLSALLMVSTVPFIHIGNSLFGRMSFAKLISILLATALLAWQATLTLFIAATLYVCYGLGYGVFAMLRNARRGKDPLTDEDEESAEDAGLPIADDPTGPAHGR